jgi:uncharacterized protein RhaS with RHS repeats
MYMRNRMYDPATGQFTQTDPIGIAGGLNTYGFAAGDPVTYNDPYGLSAQDADDQQQPGKEVSLGIAGNRVRNRCGTEQLCRALITHYARGSGNLRLSDATFQDIVRVASGAEVSAEARVLFNGTEATAKVINFYGTKYGNALGRATVYYDAQGEAIGFRDRVDFESRDWGERPFFGEIKTRAVDAALTGNPFEVNYIKRTP